MCTLTLLTKEIALNADGSLDWYLPQGKWTIMRFRYAFTLAKNRPAVPSGVIRSR